MTWERDKNIDLVQLNNGNELDVNTRIDNTLLNNLVHELIYLYELYYNHSVGGNDNGSMAN